MLEYVYVITCKRSQNLSRIFGTEIKYDWYVVNPVYSDEKNANEKLEECREKYSKYTDKNGVVWNNHFALEKIKVSRKESE